MARPTVFWIASMLLLTAASVALAQFGPSQPGSSRNTGPFGPSPQQHPYPQQPHPQQPYPRQPYLQQPYPQQVHVSLVGVWSTTLHDTRGQAIASIFIQFAPDGRYQKRMIVRGGQTDVFGVWQYDAQNAILHSQAQDYAPRNIPPSEPMGQTYSLRLQWVSTNHFITQDVSGPVRWVRQQ
ncbi:MAG: hypothetical protein KF889_13975 [Alphaproteobacteria bacterium]|nr:hypothetical protein [Alphaproteobacteria bacterium]MCW5738894.1 hypothetical protein [Alphaproteobacteria bacterium]